MTTFLLIDDRANELLCFLAGPLQRQQWYYQDPVVPVAYQVILESGVGQFREFEPRREHTRINSWGLFLVHKLTCGKRESMS